MEEDVSLPGLEVLTNHHNSACFTKTSKYQNSVDILAYF